RERSRWRAHPIPIPRRRNSSSTSTTTSRSTSVRPIPPALATRCSARSSPEWTSLTRSRRRPPAPADRFPRTCRSKRSSSPKPTSSTRNKRAPMVILHTNHGDITLQLDAENAPATVANFLQYVRDGHYDNTVFHRVIDGFMIQGGGFAPGMRQKPTRAPFANEAANGLKNERYTIAMADRK